MRWQIIEIIIYTGKIPTQSDSPLAPQRSISGALPVRLVQNALLLGSCLFAPDDTPTVHWVCPIALIVSIISLEAVPKRLLTLHIVFISLEKLRQL